MSLTPLHSAFEMEIKFKMLNIDSHNNCKKKEKITDTIQIRGPLSINDLQKHDNRLKLNPLIPCETLNHGVKCQTELRFRYCEV